MVTKLIFFPNQYVEWILAFLGISEFDYCLYRLKWLIADVIWCKNRYFLGDLKSNSTMYHAKSTPNVIWLFFILNFCTVLYCLCFIKSFSTLLCWIDHKLFVIWKTVLTLSPTLDCLCIKSQNYLPDTPKTDEFII